MKSIASYPERGPWGDSKWRGNCTGYLFRDLFNWYQPKVFVDPMMGSGTSIEVARSMGIDATGLDLHTGFNVLRDSIRQTVGREADMVVSHPPYHDMIVYSGKVWGDEPHPDDLSRCASEEEFIEKMLVALLNQREGTRCGGLYGTLIGDLRRGGRYSCYSAELMARLPRAELAAVIIKAQHNCTSDRRSYALQHPRIAHEYLLLWEKPRKALVGLLEVLYTTAHEHAQRVRTTWRAIVRAAMCGAHQGISLAEIYARVQASAGEKLAANPHWKEKIRQVLQRYPEFQSTTRGNWSLA